MLHQDANFSGYLDWLEAEVKRREIDKKYVPLACTKEEFDPISQRPIGVSRYDERDGWIDGYLDLWLDDPAKEHISILGEFGTGKTWFAFHYAWTALQRYRDAQKRGVERPRLPLVITLRDYAKALNVENVLAGFFFTQHNIRLNSEVFDQLNSMGKLLLIFDGFDEMAAKCDRQQMINNFWELAKVVVPGAKVILTCRTEHFPEAKEGRALLNAELLASTASLTGETPQFEVLELEKFNDEQIRQVLSFKAEPTTVEQVMSNPQLLDLARRPVMTELILEALPDIEAGKPVDMSRVYLYAVRRKMERDIKAERTFTSLADKLYFLCELSWEMLSTNEMSINYRLFPDRIRRLFGSLVREEKDLDHWHYDMMGQTLLIRNADGDYTPAHRSLLEFFVAYKFAAELGALADDFTQLAQAQSHLDASAAPQNYTWSSYFQRQMERTGNILPIPPLKAFESESLERLQPTFGQGPLTKAVMDLILPMLTPTPRRGTILSCPYPLLDILEATRGKTEREVGYVGGNAATLLVKADREVLEGRNFSRAVIRSANFSDASLREVNFAEANLTDCVFPKVLGGVFSVAFSPDGKIFATGDANCEISLWKVANNAQILRLQGHSDWVRSVVFSPDGKTIASASYDHTVKLWDMRTGKCLKTLQGHTSRVNSVAISPDGTILASGSTDYTVKLWDSNTGQCLKTLHGHNRRVNSVAISRDGTILVSCSSRNQTIRLWDMRTGKCVKTLQERDVKTLASVAISPDGTILGSCSHDHTVKLWDSNTGQYLKTLQGHTDWVRSIAFSPNGTILASCSCDLTIKLWNIHTGECLKTLQGHTDGVRSVAFSPNGTTLISGGDDQTVRHWDILTGECVNILQGCISTVRSVAIGCDGTILVSSSEDQTVKLWDMRTGKCFKTLYGHSSRVNSVAISPDGTTLISSSYDRTVKLWDVRTGECLKTLQGHNGGVNSVAISSDNRTLASGSGDKTIKLWDIRTGECLKSLQGHTDWIGSVAISPDRKTLASGSYDMTVKLWDINTGKCLTTLQGHTHRIHSVAISPDGKTLASGSYDTSIKLWDISTGECLKTLQGHTSELHSVVFSPTGTTLVSCSYDQTVKQWDISTGECLKTIHGHTYSVRSVVFSPDGKIIASGSSDETIKLWDLKTGECLKTLSNKPYAGMNIIDVKGLTEAEKASLKALGAVENDESSN